MDIALILTLSSAVTILAIICAIVAITLMKGMYKSMQNALLDSATYRTRNARLNDALEKSIKEVASSKNQILQIDKDIKSMIARHAEELRKAYENGGEVVLERMKIKEN